MNQVTIVMYHFVRELPLTRYPKIKGLLASQFKEQLDYLSKHYTFVTAQDCIDAVYADKNDFPKNAVLLTFDDAYIDHYTTVFPLLEERGIQGCFFPPAKAIMDNEVLDVNKIHFLIASVSNLDDLLKNVYGWLDKCRSEYQLESNKHYFSKLAEANRFDPKEVIFVKRLLQRELDEKLRNVITDELFKKYVSRDEHAFSRELYMNVDQLKCMIRNGMYVGSHGYEHHWLGSLSPEKQEREVKMSLQFLEHIGSPTDNWIMCYPYGNYNESLINILKKNGCRLGLTTEVNIAALSKDKAHTLPRLDTNDLPKAADAEPNEFTRKVLNTQTVK